MDSELKALCGSPNRDRFKLLHKQLSPLMWGCDIDFALISKDPPDIAAVLDYKQSREAITFSEVIAYNALIKRGLKVFIVSGNVELGLFDIREYIAGHHGKPTYELSQPKRVNNWKEFEQWEMGIRDQHKKKWSP